MTHNVTGIDFVVLFFLKSTTSVDITEHDGHMHADKTELNRKWNACWSLGKSVSAYEAVGSALAKLSARRGKLFS